MPDDESVAPPEAPQARQAIDSLGGYAYQLYASALAWLRLKGDTDLFLEVAEDYATVAADALMGTQVKREQGKITLNSAAVIQAIDNFVQLVRDNPDRLVSFDFLTTAEPTTERALSDRVDGIGGIDAWRSVASGAPIDALRARLNAMDLKSETKAYIAGLDNAALRSTLVEPITWVTGAPSSQVLFKRFQDGLLDLGRPRGISAMVADGAAYQLCGWLLQFITEDGERRLSSADLLRLFDEVTRESVPSGTVARLATALEQRFSTETSGLRVAESVLEPLQDQTQSGLVIPRPELENACANGLRGSAGLWLHGGVGYGKTTIATRLIASSDRSWSVLRLRSQPASSAEAILNRARVETSTKVPGGILIDDLPPELFVVGEATASFMDGLRADGVPFIITSGLPPDLASRDRLGLTADAVHPVGEMTEDEVANLVQLAGGDAAVWAKYVFLSSAGGHPQLAQALSIDLRDKGWPRDEIASLDAMLGMNSGIEATRDAVHRRLMASLSNEQRVMLYRSSIVIGTVTNEIRSAIAEVSPPVRFPGDAATSLSATWVEPVTNGYRVSPLVSGAGHRGLGQQEIVATHAAVARSLVNRPRIDGNDISRIVVHGLAGDAEDVLSLISAGLLRLDHDEAKRLAVISPMAALRTDQPLYRRAPVVGVMLRAAQLLFAAADEDASPEGFRAIEKAFEDELAAIEDSKSSSMLGLLVRSKLLISAGYAAKSSDFIVTLKKVAEARVDLPKTIEGPGGEDLLIAPFLTSLQILESPSVEAATHIIRSLITSECEPVSDILTHLREPIYDFYVSLLVPWSRATKAGDPSNDVAADAYLDLAEALQEAGHEKLATLSFCAAATAADETTGDQDRALAILDTANGDVPNDPEILRVRSRVLLHAGRIDEQLALVEEDLDTLASANPIAAAFFLREVAIGQSRKGRPADAALTLLKAAAKGADSIGMPFKSCLLVDAGVEFWRAGQTARAIEPLGQGYDVTLGMSADAGAQEAASIRLCGAQITFVWSHAKADPRQFDPREVPGPAFASAYYDNAQMQEYPPVDGAAPIYMLADLERRLGQEGEFTKRREELPSDEKLPLYDVMSATEEVLQSVRDLNVEKFVKFVSTASLMSLLQKYPTEQQSHDFGDLMTGGGILNRDLTDAEQHVVQETAAVFVTQISLRLLARFDGARVFEFLSSLSDTSSPLIPRAIDAALRGDAPTSNDPLIAPSVAQAAAFGVLAKAVSGESTQLEQIVLAFLRLFETMRSSPNADILLDDAFNLANRLLPEIVNNQRFRLRNPDEAVASITQALSADSTNGRRFQNLLLRLTEATTVELGADFKQLLRA